MTDPHPAFRHIAAAALATLPIAKPADPDGPDAPDPPTPDVRHPALLAAASPTATLFLSGPIVNNWHATALSLLRHLPLTVFDPLRPDWDSSWRNEAEFAPLRQQVNWESEALLAAEMVLVYFSSGDVGSAGKAKTEAPVTLLEFGMVVGRRGGSGVVCVVEEGYSKRANVEIVCARERIKVWRSLADGCREVERRVGEKERVEGKGAVKGAS